MQRTASNTHGQAAGAAGSAPAGELLLGTLTLPAGGPWNIFGAWAQMVAATMTAAEVVSGHLRIASPSGDITPNPAPLELPTGFGPSQLGATANTQQCPLNIWPLDLVAAGKSTIELYAVNDVITTGAPQWVAGLLYGLEIVEQKPAHWYDSVRAGVTAATLTALGTITLSEGASEIVSVTAVVAQAGVLVTAEELLGFIQISSDDLQIQPLQLPISAAISAGLGATIGNGPCVQPVMIPVSIPVKGGARLDIFVDLNTAVTNAANCKVVIGYR